jgi:hypothetical protein
MTSRCVLDKLIPVLVDVARGATLLQEPSNLPDSGRLLLLRMFFALDQRYRQRALICSESWGVTWPATSASICRWSPGHGLHVAVKIRPD